MGPGRKPAGRVGIFPGTFDPITLGHIDIASRAFHFCDDLIMAVAHAHHKQTLFTIKERVAFIEDALPVRLREHVRVKPFKGLLVEFAKRESVQIAIRGLRVISDFEYEFQMALMNKRLWPNIETVFLMPGEEFIYLNSTVVKEVARCGGPTADLVPPNVDKALRDRFQLGGE
ncbi:MAG: pantetheine-phosphate adenylyltransferase [Candidatus Eisenbacteria sp.]|nr:pantetheine-phosphate adenylyltransferase [Candidatus Eisenbacteria bacterium]